MEYKVDFKAISWDSPLEGMRQKIRRLGERQLRLVEYAKDLPPHWCEKGHIGYLLEGKMEIRFADGSQIVSAGDGIASPSGQEHRHMAVILTEKVTCFFLEDV